MLEVGREYLVTIEKQDHFGAGICRIDGMLVFVENALPQEKVWIEIVSVKKKYAKAVLKKIVSSSSSRCTPACLDYDICGGCQLMHQNGQHQIAWKEMKVKELFSKIVDVHSIKFFPILCGNPFHYRNKVIFHGNQKHIGFYQEKTHEIAPISNCLLIEKPLNDIYHKILEYFASYSQEFIHDVMIRKTSLGEVMVSIQGKVNSELFKEQFQNQKITSLYINHQLIFGKEAIVEDIFGMKFQIFPQAFFQVNYEMMKQLYQIVVSYYQKNRYHQILDLYCGTGTIGMLVSPYVDHVIGVEVIEDAIKSARKNQKVNGISNIKFLLGKVEDYIDSFQEIDSIIVDPPRSGLDSKTINAILTLSPKSIIYVSCDPATLTRDLGILLAQYQLEEVHMVDMFPNTYHVECVCVLKLK